MHDVLRLFIDVACTLDFPSTSNPTGIYALAVVLVTGPTNQPTPIGTCTIVTTTEIVEPRPVNP